MVLNRTHTGCSCFRIYDHGGYHGKSRRMCAYCAIKLSCPGIHYKGYPL